MPLPDLTYTITDFMKTYNVPTFTSSPDWCDIIYSQGISPVEGFGLRQSWDPLTLTFEIFNDSDITLAGNTFQFLVFGKTGNVNQITE